MYTHLGTMMLERERDKRSQAKESTDDDDYACWKFCSQAHTHKRAQTRTAGKLCDDSHNIHLDIGKIVCLLFPFLSRCSASIFRPIQLLTATAAHIRAVLALQYYTTQKAFLTIHVILLLPGLWNWYCEFGYFSSTLYNHNTTDARILYVRAQLCVWVRYVIPSQQQQNSSYTTASMHDTEIRLLYM